MQGPNSSVGLTKAFVAQPLHTSPSLAPQNIAHSLGFLPTALADATFSRKPAVASATPRGSPWSSLQLLGHSSTQPGCSCLSACSHSALGASPRWKSRAVPSVKLQPRTSKPGAEETLGKSLMKNNILFHLLVCCLS